MICTKTPYRDLAEINRQLNQKKHRDHKTPRRYLYRGHYWCQECQAFHLVYAAKGRKKPA
jgi:hypothetical protein